MAYLDNLLLYGRIINHFSEKNVYELNFGQRIRIQLSTRPKIRLCAAAEFHFRVWVQPATSFPGNTLNDSFYFVCP